MRRIQILTFGAIVAICSVLAPTQTAVAGMTGQMDRMFSEMTTTTRPGVYQGRSRTVVTGGGFSLRSRPNQNISPFSLSPPTLSAGCSGIDAYLGSFSFIGEDEIVELVKTIASQAKGYAFEAALDLLCPTCHDIISELRALSSRINAGLGDSCQAASLLVDKLMPERGAESNRWKVIDGAAESVLAGIQGAGAWLDSYSDFFDASQNRRDLGDVAPPEEMNANPLYRAAKSQGMPSWYDGGNEDLMMAILSVVGMVAVCTPTVGSTIDCEKHTPYDTDRVIPLPPGLDLVHLVYGSNSTMSPALSGEVYDCSGEPQFCLNPIRRTYEDEGLAERIKRAFVGSDGTGAGGIISKLQAGAATELTSQEEAIIAATADMTAIAFNLSMTTPDNAYSWVESWSAIVAIDMAHQLVRDAMRALKVAVSATPGYGNELALDHLEKRMVEIDDERMRLVSQATTATNLMMENYDLMRRSMAMTQHSEPLVPAPHRRTSGGMVVFGGVGEEGGG